MKKLLILIVIAIVAVVAWMSLLGDKAATPDATTTESDSATMATVETELQGLGDEDLDAEMMAIDADIKAL